MGANKEIAFLLLVGGKSSRFGRDKGSFQFQGKSLVSHQLEVLSNFENDIYIGAHSKQQVRKYLKKIDYEKATAFILDDMEVVRDENVRSPMIGIYSGSKELRNIGYKSAFIISCDMPLIQKDVIGLMLKSIEGYDLCMPKWKNGYLEPLFALYSVDCAFKRAEICLTKGKYKLSNLFDENWKINYISVEETIKELDNSLLTFLNINRPTDLETLMKYSNNP